LSDIFSAAGLPQELELFDEFDQIAIEQLELRISTDSRRYGKLCTIIHGVDDPSIDGRKLLSKLKTKCACGGSLKDGHIELQGDHARKVLALLQDIGYQVRMA
jgi:translation initiation factor 1